MWSSRRTGSPRSRRRAAYPGTATSLTSMAWCWPRGSSTATPTTTHRCCGTPTSAEIEEMRRLVGEAVDAGAIGFASSRQPAHAGAWGKPVPSRLATVDELMRLAGPLAERGRGTFAITHGPDFGPVELAELSVK